MCGRFVAATDPDGLVKFFMVDERKTDDIPPSWNVAPTDPVHAIAQHESRRLLVSFRWGLVPRWAESPKIAATMINARAETVMTKPAFRDAMRRRRCIVPADGFYEWRKGEDGQRLPHFISAGDQPMAFAGLWETWRDPALPDAPPLRTCSIITRPAEGAVTQLHDRMPLALPADAWAPWLDPQTSQQEVTALLHSEPPALRFHSVSTRVNAVRNNDATLIHAAA